MSRAFNRAILVALLGCFLLLSLYGALRESLTFDEPVHIEEGVNAWKYHTFKVDVVNPPLIKEIAVIPIMLGVAPIPGVQPNLAVFPVRFMVIFLGVLMLLWMFNVFKRHTSMNVALAALFLFAFEPNILAHAHYVTLDFGYSVIFFILYTYFIFYIVNGTQKRIHYVVLGLLLGLGLASKVSALIMIPLSFAISSFVVHGRGTLRFFWTGKLALGGAAALALVVLWGVYFFQRDTIIAPGGDETRISKRLYERARETHNDLLMKTITAAETVKIPLGTYMAMVKNSFIYGRQQGSTIFFLGSFTESKRVYYDLTVLILKTPIPLLFLVMFSSSYYFLSKQRRILLLMWIPVAATLFVTYTGSVQPSVRYMLPVFPFLCVIAALGIPHLYKRHAFLVIILGLWYIAGTLRQAPHYISYANEFAGEPGRRYVLLADSNLDWGQGLITLNEYVHANDPESLAFSYFGRDDAASYGFTSTVPYGSYKANEICEFHPVERGGSGRGMTIISVTNWYECGYREDPGFIQSQIRDVVADSFLIFDK